MELIITINHKNIRGIKEILYALSEVNEHAKAGYEAVRYTIPMATLPPKSIFGKGSSKKPIYTCIVLNPRDENAEGYVVERVYDEIEKADYYSIYEYLDYTLNDDPDPLVNGWNEIKAFLKKVKNS